MSAIAQKTLPNTILLFDPECFADISDCMFEANYWQQRQQVIGQAFGRATTTFFQHHKQQYVLRHYRRGGVISKLINNSYLYRGLKHTRAWREMHLLNWMADNGLPVPRAVAARIKHQGLCYQADIILQKIPHAKDAFTLLQQHALSESAWQAIGACIRRMHQLQVYHHDLNIHNIMLDEQHKVWLIDFDKCEVRQGQPWKQANLQRLKRSLLKEKAKSPQFFWQESDWQACMQGYLTADKSD